MLNVSMGMSCTMPAAHVLAQRQLLYELFAHNEQGLQKDVLTAWRVLKDSHLTLLLTAVDMFIEPDNFLRAADLIHLVVPMTNKKVNADVLGYDSFVRFRLNKLRQLSAESPYAQTRVLCAEVVEKLVIYEP